MPIPVSGNELKRLSAKDIIYQTVCDWIVTGVLRPGEKILDSELAKYFNVSRTPVREAIQILERQKLVNVVPGKATVVADLDPADIEKSYRPLAEIQGFAAELACAQITDEELQELAQVHAAFLDACRRNDAQEVIARDARFHELIIHAARNEYVEEFSRMLVLHIQRIKYRYFHSDRMRKISITHHEAILKAMEQRDAEKGKALLRDHWLRVMENAIQESEEVLQEPKNQ